MKTLYRHGKISWTDLENPSTDEVKAVMEEHHLNPLVAEELLSPTLKPKVDLYPTFVYLILHFPAFKHTHAGSNNQEVDFVVGKNYLITTHYDTIDPLHKFSKVFEVSSILDRSDIGTHAGYVFYYMLKKLYKAVEHELEFLNQELLEIEARVFRGEERRMVERISLASREILRFKQSLRAHREILESLERAGSILFGEGFHFHLKGITGEYFRVYSQILSLADSLSELRETNNSLLSSKQNEVMKVLAVIAFIALPLSILASLFQIDTVSRPIVGMENDFWLILALMAAVALVLVLYFRLKKWL